MKNLVWGGGLSASLSVYVGIILWAIYIQNCSFD